MGSTPARVTIKDNLKHVVILNYHRKDNMKPIFIKILCWILGIGAVGYIGLTIANSFPGISGLVGKVPIINSIPTPVIDVIAESTMKDGCKSDFAEGTEIKVVRISDAPKSEGSYHRWGCVAINPNATEEESQKFLEEFKKYKEWSHDSHYDYIEYAKAECKYYNGTLVLSNERTNISPMCVNNAFDSDFYRNSKLETLEYLKKYDYIAEIIDYSKE